MGAHNVSRIHAWTFPLLGGGAHFRGWLKLAKTQFQLFRSFATYRQIFKIKKLKKFFSKNFEFCLILGTPLFRGWCPFSGGRLKLAKNTVPAFPELRHIPSNF